MQSKGQHKGNAKRQPADGRLTFHLSPLTSHLSRLPSAVSRPQAHLFLSIHKIINMAKKNKNQRNDSRENRQMENTRDNDKRERISPADDLTDSARDQERLEADKANLDLPDVKDIPGQEFVHVPRMGELADTTISSDDEEGVGLFQDDEEDETIMGSGMESDVTRTDKQMFENMDHLQGADDDRGVQRAALDNRDFEGDKLNETSGVAGSDLDTSGVDADDSMENIGEEDEENNQWTPPGGDR